MDTHIQGPRGKTAKGSLLSVVGYGAKFGDAAIVAKEIFRTDGLPAVALGGVAAFKTAPQQTPLLLQLLLHVVTAFDGTGPVLKLEEQNLDGSGSVIVVDLATGVLGSGAANTTNTRVGSHKVITGPNKKYMLTYTVATGGPTAGEAYIIAKLSGLGMVQP